MTVELWFTAHENDTMQTMSFPDIEQARAHWDALDENVQASFAIVTIRDEDEGLIAELKPAHLCERCGDLVIQSRDYEGFGLCEVCADAAEDEAIEAAWMAYRLVLARALDNLTSTIECSQCGEWFSSPDGNDLCPDCQQWVDAHMHDAGAGEPTP